MAQSTPLPFLIIQRIFPILERMVPKIAGQLGYYLFFRPIPVPYKQEERTAMEQAESMSLLLDNRKIQCYCWSKGVSQKTAVFMHGWSGKAVQPYRLIEAMINDGYTVYAFDGPGHGASDGKRTHVFEFTDLLFQLQQRIGTFDMLIGHSFGSIASCNALKNGLLVRQYVSLSAPTIASDILAEFAKMVNCSKITTDIMKELIFDEAGQEFHTISIEYIAPELPKIPLLIVHDKEDKRVGWFNSERMAELIPEAEFFSTTGLGHNRIMNDTQVIDRILEFANKS